MERSNEQLTRRQMLAANALQALIDFADFEEYEIPVPYEFLGTMQGLAAVVKKPDQFIFDWENGRVMMPAEREEYIMRLNVLKKVLQARQEAETAIKFCASCERDVTSDEARICLWCGNKLVVKMQAVHSEGKK